jgi:hypothetical protein
VAGVLKLNTYWYERILKAANADLKGFQKAVSSYTVHVPVSESRSKHYENIRRILSTPAVFGKLFM